MRLPLLLASTTLAALATAQSPIVVPNGLAAVEGASSTAYPWGRGVSQIRVQYIYDSTNFTAQSVSGPILINGLRWRANGAGVGVGSTYNVVTIKMATCPVDQALASTTFASNLGPDLATVYNGPVTVAVGAGTTPNNWYATATLPTPFLYDPSAGDLTFDIATDALGWVGAVGAAVDCATTGALTSRVYNLTSYTATTGTFQANVGITCEISFTNAAGAATVTSYGTGCYDRASATFYEVFPLGTFDLSNTTIRLTPTGGGYAMSSAPNTWFTPVAANLGLTDDSVSVAQPLGFTLNYPGGSTSSVFISSNGFVWAQTGGVNGCCAGDPVLLLAQGARWCPIWGDFNPGVGGTVTFDQDVPNNAAHVTFTNVPEYGTTTPNTFQVSFFSSGVIEYRFQSCSVLNHVLLTGWSPGNNARDPGGRDISATLPFVTQPDLSALVLSGSPRPVLGNTVILTTSNIPAGTGVGATILSFTQYNPGLDLTGLGMPGCRQYVALNSVQLFFPSGSTGSNSFFIPNNPVYAGVHVFVQSAAFAAGLNALGVISANGLDLLTGTL